MDDEAVSEQAAQRALALLGVRPYVVEGVLDDRLGRVPKHREQPATALSVSAGVGLRPSTGTVPRRVALTLAMRSCRRVDTLAQVGVRAVHTSAPSSITAIDACEPARVDGQQLERTQSLAGRHLADAGRSRPSSHLAWTRRTLVSSTAWRWPKAKDATAAAV